MLGERNIYHTAPVEPKVSVTLYGAPDTPQPGRLSLPVLDDISGLELDETGRHRTDPFNSWRRRGRLRRARFRLHLSPSRSAITVLRLHTPPPHNRLGVVVGVGAGL